MFVIYWRVEQKCKKYTKLIGCYPLKLMFVAAFIYSIYCIWSGNHDTSTWVLPYTISVPFDTKPIHGWYMLWVIETNIGVTYALSMITISSFFVCCCFYIAGICEHFDFLMVSLNEITESIRNEKNPIKIKKQHLEMKRKLAQAINIHINIFE